MRVNIIEARTKGASITLKRVAIFLPGAIGRPTGMHVPAIVGLVRRLSEHFDITVYSFVKPDGDDQPFLCGNANVTYVRARFDDAMPKKIIQFMKAFYSDHRIERFDLLHGFWALPCGLIAVALGKLFKLPSLVSLQGSEAASLPEINYGDMRRQPVRSLSLWTCRQSTALTMLTRYQWEALRKFGLTRTDCSIIPHGADASFYVDRQAQAISPPVNFLHVGYLNKVKDQGTMLRTFQMVNRNIPSRLRIIGEGWLRESLESLARELGIEKNVEFIGHLPHAQLPEYYRQADVMLHTSLFEGQGVSIAEAAASRVLICGTNVGLVSDLGPEAAVAVQAGDHSMLAEKILELIHDPEKIARLRENALRWASAHSADWTAVQYKMIYNQLTTQ